MNTKPLPKKLSGNTQKPLPPAEYNRYLKSLDLVNVYLTDVKCSLYSKSFESKVSLDFDESSELSDYSEGRALFHVGYRIRAKSGRSRLFETRVKYAVEFTAATDVPREFFDTYKTLSLPLQTFPYLRECVNTLISRMGLPPLILPLRKFLVGSDK